MPAAGAGDSHKVANGNCRGLVWNEIARHPHLTCAGEHSRSLPDGTLEADRQVAELRLSWKRCLRLIDEQSSTFSHELSDPFLRRSQTAQTSTPVSIFRPAKCLRQRPSRKISRRARSVGATAQTSDGAIEDAEPQFPACVDIRQAPGRRVSWKCPANRNAGASFSAALTISETRSGVALPMVSDSAISPQPRSRKRATTFATWKGAIFPS